MFIIRTLNREYISPLQTTERFWTNTSFVLHLNFLGEFGIC